MDVSSHWMIDNDEQGLLAKKQNTIISLYFNLSLCLSDRHYILYNPYYSE